ncbi:ribosomal RNA-processing protein 8 isoform X3 [Hippopotamus amphibius kiboko]|uniref:ribosomal RNA-processing protein 8 isoform X3 n=1 Tax=Hippopotamus amphibius kiboko TaxID=575201 RepID=UPI002596B871|nr:ribosomal RNA-processing protein 8 isoform X3 [Hippopotamus amphibius kiboko]
MFEEPEWAEEAPVVADLGSVALRPRPTPASQIKGSKHHQLLATLRALEAASLPQQPPSLPGSDSEEEEEVVERKKKRPKKALFASASTEVEEKRKKKCPKQGPPSSDSKEEKVERKKYHEGALLGSDSAEEETRKRKCQKQAPSNPAQPLGSVDQTGSHGARAEALRARMAQRLDGARFRYLNEQLYSGPSSAAQRLFQEDPEAFLLYHRGFQNQVKKWPLQPVDRIARDLRQQPASLVVADFGCGDCRLASSIRNPVYCFDLASLDPRVTVCDMAQVPLEDESVDVAVFCLSLMGTNIRDFLEEANRVLKPGGLLKVAEVSSRFEDVRTFLGSVTKLGFKVISKDLTNSHFFLFDFQKTGPPRVGPKAQLSGLKLQPCLYKRR